MDRSSFPAFSFPRRVVLCGFLGMVVLVVGGATTVEAQPALVWHVGLGTDSEEHVHEGMQTSDGGYVAVGHGAEPSGNRLDMLVIKTDASGNEQWQTRIGTSGKMDVGIAIAETDDGFVVGGGLYSAGRQRRALVGLDHAGNVVWQQTYGGGGAGAVRGVEVLGDGTIVATGYVDSDEQGFVFLAEATAFLMKVDASGGLLWDRTIAGMQGTKVREESGGGFAVLSAEWVFAGGVDALNAKLIRTDASGNTTWSQTYGGSNHIDPFDFDLTSDGGFILGGHTTGYGTQNWDCLLMKIDAGGNETWHRIFGQPRGYSASFIHDECYGVRQAPSGGYVMVGGSGDEYGYSADGHPAGPSDEWKAYLIVTDAAGNTIEEEVFGDGAGLGNNAAEYLSLTNDGCYMLFTDTDSAAPPDPNNFGFMKICGGGGLCGDGNVDVGEQCDDGNGTDCDGCDNDCTPSSTCGNGAVCGVEQCDDGNTSDGDCCSASCTFEGAGSSCDDGSLCTGPDLCDGAGTCDGSAMPASGCRAADSAKILIRGQGGDPRSSLSWLWKGGPQVDYAELGDPLGAGTDYALCVYDGAGAGSRLAASMRMPAAEECAGRPCWKAKPGKNLSYKDKELSPDGVQLLFLKAGAEGKAKIKVRGKGPLLPVPSLPVTQTPSLEIQLRNSVGSCWSTTFETSSARNEEDRFQAKY